MKFWRQIVAIVWKDITSEIRTKEYITSVIVFTLFLIVILKLVFNSNHESLRLVSPSMLWVIFTFAGVLSLNHTFVMEKEEACIEGLLACPINREAIYTGKMLGNLIFMLVIEAVALPTFGLLYDLPAVSLEVVTITFLATVGFVAIGTTFSAMAVNTRMRETLLAILFLPVVSPVIISATKASELVISGETWGSIATWLEVIVAFDIIFVVASYLVFAFVIEE